MRSSASWHPRYAEIQPPHLERDNSNLLDISFPSDVLAIMSRQAQPNSVDVVQPEEEEAVSGTGEGDEAMEDVEEQEEGYSSSTPTSTLTWISWFCSLPGHEYFCEVSEDFIEDDFNLTGLNAMVPFWKEAMEMVLDVEPDEDASKIPDVSIVEASAELLYGLVHQRYILTRAGLQAMVDKYEAGAFGSCPRVYCNGCNVVPCGRSDLPGLDTVKLFCPNCNDIYTPPSSRFQGVDGAFFGTTFAHLFFQSYRELAPAPFWKPPSTSGSSTSPRSSGGSPSHVPPFVNPNPHGGQKRAAGKVYLAKIYGFKVSERAKNGPRMQWLRLRPRSPEEVDMVDWRGRWLDDDDDYDDDEDVDEDRPMEDFDPDAAEGEDDDEEEEEEEEAPSSVKGKQAAYAAADSSRRTSTPDRPPSSPASSMPPRTPRDELARISISGVPLDLAGGTGSKVRVVRQWATRGTTAQVC
ncbi:casein kinase II regulatory subunit-domain-containing protein [Amylocystis lapponica]|nr:casein kinase II regulatory subunit-domain-containing protein [Amylocystis lapponica]